MICTLCILVNSFNWSHVVNINKMYCVVAVRMWSRISIDLDEQAEQAGLDSASASTREERRTSSAMWKTVQYVSYLVPVGLRGWMEFSEVTEVSLQGITFRRVGVPTANDIIKSSSKDAVRYHL